MGFELVERGAHGARPKDVQGTEYIEWIRCPRCGSNSINAGIKKNGSVLARCRACARKWEVTKEGKIISATADTRFKGPKYLEKKPDYLSRDSSDDRDYWNPYDK